MVYDDVYDYIDRCSMTQLLGLLIKATKRCAKEDVFVSKEKMIKTITNIVNEFWEK